MPHARGATQISGAEGSDRDVLACEGALDESRVLVMVNLIATARTVDLHRYGPGLQILLSTTFHPSWPVHSAQVELLTNEGLAGSRMAPR